jgi:hypothetical protein
MTQREGLALVVLILVVLVFVIVRVGPPQSQDQLSPSPVVIPSPTLAAPQVLVDDTRLIDEGQFVTESFQLNHAATVTISVSLKSGAAIDSYFVDEQGLYAWQAMANHQTSSSFRYLTELTMAPLNGDYTRSVTLAPGKYALIIDNSRLGATAPPFHFFKKTPAFVAFKVTVQ